MDYFGYRAAAQKLATALKGKLLIPSYGDSSPQTAIVQATVAGIAVEIDFLFNVLGVRQDSLEREAVEIVVPIRTPTGEGELSIPVMHPLHCLQSRVANIINLHRKDDVAIRQLNAAPIVLQRYIDELIDLGDVREAKRTLQALFSFLEGSPEGRRAHTLDSRDPGDIIIAFRGDRRLDVRYRWFNLRSMSMKIRHRRNAAA